MDLTSLVQNSILKVITDAPSHLQLTATVLSKDDRNEFALQNGLECIIRSVILDYCLARFLFCLVNKKILYLNLNNYLQQSSFFSFIIPFCGF